MHHLYNPTKNAPGASGPVRNNYYYAKLLGVEDFQRETRYMILKRWMLNRLVSGYGVICGLDVVATPDHTGVYITAGWGIDRWGRDFEVRQDTEPYLLPMDLLERPSRESPQEEKGPAQEGRDPGRPPEDVRQGKWRPDRPTEETWIHVVICYMECLGDPTPVMAGDCDDGQECAPGSIYERFRIEFRPGKVDPFPIWDCQIPDVIERDQLDYPALVNWVTRNCPELEEDPCLPLANIRIDWVNDEPHCRNDEIDISIRTLVFGGDLLFRLVMSSIIESPRRRSK